MQGINDRIKELRVKLEMSQEEFGKKIGLSKSGISNIENGIRSISDRHIKLICNAFNVNESWLVSGENSIFYLSNVVKKTELFIKYLESLGYMIKLKSKVLKWHYEDQLQDGIVIGQAQVSDKETFTVTITKEKISTTMTEAEFEEFQETIKRSVEFEIFKASQK